MREKLQAWELTDITRFNNIIQTDITILYNLSSNHVTANKGLCNRVTSRCAVVFVTSLVFTNNANMYEIFITIAHRSLKVMQTVTLWWNYLLNKRYSFQATKNIVIYSLYISVPQYVCMHAMYQTVYCIILYDFHSQHSGVHQIKQYISI